MADLKKLMEIFKGTQEDPNMASIGETPDPSAEQEAKQDLVNREINSEVASANADKTTSMSTKEEPKAKSIQDLMDSYLSGREEYEQKLKDARATDKKFEASAGLAQALANLGQSSMAARSGAPIKKTKFAAPKFDSASGIVFEREGQLKDLLTASKLQKTLEDIKTGEHTRSFKDRSLGLQEKTAKEKQDLAESRLNLDRELGTGKQDLARNKAYYDITNQQEMMDLRNKQFELDKKLAEKKMSTPDYQREKLALEKKALDIKEKALKGKSTDKLTKGQEELDKKFAQKVAEYHDSGKQKVETNLRNMDKAIDIMEKDPNLFKGIGGKFIEVMDSPMLRKAFNPQGQAVKDLVNSVSMQDLKKTLGGQFAEREGRLLMDAFFNAATPEIALKKLKELRSYTEKAKGKQERDISSFMKAGGTTSGMKIVDDPSEKESSEFSGRKEGDTWSDDSYDYRVINGKVQRKAK